MASPSPRCICPGSGLGGSLFIHGGDMEIECNVRMANPPVQIHPLLLTARIYFSHRLETGVL